MVLLCNLFCQDFSVTVIYKTHQVRCYHFFIVEIIDENEFNTDVKIEVVVYGET